MPLQLPAEIAMEMQQKNQLYTLAFELYKCYHPTDRDAEELAKVALECARVFIKTVQEDQKNG